MSVEKTENLLKRKKRKFNGYKCEKINFVLDWEQILFFPMHSFKGQVLGQLSYLQQHCLSNSQPLPSHLVIACNPWLMESASKYLKEDLGLVPTNYKPIYKNDSIYPMYFCFEKDLRN